MSTLKKDNKKILLQIKDADKRLREICFKGMNERFGLHPADAVKDRLDHELKVVSKNKHSSYYLLASMLAQEAVRLHNAFLFRGTITSSLIAYTSGISDVNPMEAEYGGVNLPFETTREEFEGIAPTLDMQCGITFVLFAQALLAKELPGYRCLSYPLAGGEGIRSIRVYLVKEDEMPETDPLDIEGTNMDEYPDFIFFDDYNRITLIADNEMELVRYNKFYSDNEVLFDEMNSDKVISKIWRLAKKEDQSLAGFKRLKVKNYEELITVLSMAHSTDAWAGMAKKKVLDGSLPLSDMIGSRDDVFTYLQKIGFDNKEAYTIMERVRKGKRLTDEQLAEMKKNGAEDWVLDFCQHVRYLFPRAHVAQMIRKLAFCIQEPASIDEYQKSDHVILRDAFMG